ncbi:MAG: hypothetical protein K6F00_09360, partial [Lachnospiraceae bacterium]|nr:hypothetical protein [Lachnospiraceae bacterium]
MPRYKKRRIDIPNKLFHILWDGACKSTDKIEFINTYTHPASDKCINFYKKYSLNPRQTHILLREIYNKSHL